MADRKRLDAYEIEEIRSEKVLGKFKDALSQEGDMVKIEMGNNRVGTRTYFMLKSSLEELLKYGDELRLNKGLKIYSF